MTKFTRNQILEKLDAFAKYSYYKTGSYSNACGWFESALATQLAELPRDRQEFLLSLFETELGK